MRLSYTGSQNASLDIDNLRHAFGLYPVLRDLWIDWSLTNAAPSPSFPLPPLPPAKGVPPPERILEGLKTITLNISDRKARQHALPKDGTSPQPLMVQHLGQLLPIVAVPSLEELDIRMHFQETSISIRKALKQTAEKLKGAKLENLKRLGLSLDFELDFKKEISGGWVSGGSWLLRSLPLTPVYSSRASARSSHSLHGSHRPSPTSKSRYSSKSTAQRSSRYPRQLMKSPSSDSSRHANKSSTRSNNSQTHRDGKRCCPSRCRSWRKPVCCR